MIATASPPPVTMPDVERIRDRLGELSREANHLRRLLRLLNKQPPPAGPSALAFSLPVCTGRR